MPVIDHHALSEAEGLEEEMEVDLVSFNGSAEEWWIHEKLGPAYNVIYGRAS